MKLTFGVGFGFFGMGVLSGMLISYFIEKYIVNKKMDSILEENQKDLQNKVNDMVEKERQKARDFYNKRYEEYLLREREAVKEKEELLESVKKYVEDQKKAFDEKETDYNVNSIECDDTEDEDLFMEDEELDVSIPETITRFGEEFCDEDDYLDRRWPEYTYCRATYIGDCIWYNEEFHHIINTENEAPYLEGCEEYLDKIPEGTSVYIVSHDAGAVMCIDWSSYTYEDIIGGIK